MLFIWLKTLGSFRSYRQLAAASAGRTVLFCVYLLLMGVLLFNVYFSFQLNKHLPPFANALPAMTIEKGMLTAPQDPVTVHLPGTDLSVRLQAQPQNPPSQQEFTRQGLLAFVSGNMIYMPTMAGVQGQPLPENVNITLTPQTIQQYLPAMRSILQSAAFLGSFFALGIFMVFSVLLAAAVAFLWRGLTRTAVPAAVLWRWAAFLQGPALALWLINLFFGVPLFMLALFILFNIYTQQIFNTVLYER